MPGVGDIGILRMLVFGLVGAGLIVGFVGCNRKATSRSRDEIFRELQSLPVLYLTGASRREVVDSGTKGNFVDAKTGEICWRAMECSNPSCPDRKGKDVPVIFITPDPAMFVKPDGTFGYDAAKARAGADLLAGGACPGCLTRRILKAETQADRDQYARFVQPHTLPASAKRKAALDREMALARR